MTAPLQDLTVRLTLDDKLSASLRAAAEALGRLGGQTGASVKPAQAAILELDRQGRAALERLSVGAQESAAAVQKSVAGIESAVDGANVGGNIGQGFEDGAKGVSILDASAGKLAGTLTGLAAGFFAVSKAVQLLNEGVARSRAFDEAFRDLPVLLGLSADGANALAESIRRLAEIRGIPVLDALASVEESVRNGTGTAAEALKSANDSLELYSAGLARAQDGTKLVTDALSAYGQGVEQADEFTRLIGASLLTTRDNSQALAGAFDRLLPKAARVGASFEDLLSVYGGLRRGGLTLEGSIQALDQTLTQFGTTDFRQKVAAYGEDISRAAVEANGFGATIDRLNASFGQNDDLLGSLSTKGQGLGTVLTTLGRSGDSAADSLDRLRNAQQQFIDAAAAGQQAILAQEGQIRARFDNLVDRVGQGARAATVALAAEAQALFDTLAQLGSGSGSARGIQFFDEGADLEVQSLIASADVLEQSLGKVSLAAAKAQQELADLRGQEVLLRGLGVDGEYEARRTALEKRVADLRAEEERALGELTAARLQRDAAAAARIATEAAEAQAQITAKALATDIRFTGLQDSALRAINAIELPPLTVNLEAQPVPESVANAARKLLEFASQASNPGDEAQAQAREYLAIVQQFTQAQSQSEQLLATLRARSLDGTERQVAESKILLDSIAKQIDAYAAEGLAVDDLRKALEGLRAAEARRADTDAGKRARDLADQQAALSGRVDGLGAGLATGLDAAFSAIDDKVRAATDAVEKFREARIAAGTATPAELAGLDALIAKAIGLSAILKDDARTKLGENLAASLRDVDAAVAGLGKGLQTGLDATFSEIDSRVQGVLERIEKARQDGQRSGLLSPEQVALLDDAAAKARLLGDALKFDAQTDKAQQLLGVLAEITRQTQAAALTALPEAAQQFGRAAIELRKAQSDATLNILKDAQILGLDDAQAKEQVDATLAALEREFVAQSSRLTLDFVLRPQIEIEEGRLRDQLEAQLAPIAASLQAQIAAASADGTLDDAEIQAIAAAFDEARVAAEGFRQEVVQGSEAFEAGFTATIADRIKDATDDFATGAKIAGAAFDAFGDSLGDAFMSIVDGSKSASEAFKDFVKSFLTSIAQAITQALAFQATAGIFGGLGLGGPEGGIFAQGGIMPGEMQKPTGFADGGVMPGAMTILSDGKRLPTVNYAQGGVARSPQMAVFAEKPGMAEAFVPLPGPDRGIPVEFKNMPGAQEPPEAQQSVTQNTVSVSFTIQALDGASVREILAREARTIEDLVASAVSSGANRGLMESVRSAGNPARG